MDARYRDEITNPDGSTHVVEADSVDELDAASNDYLEGEDEA